MNSKAVLLLLGLLLVFNCEITYEDDVAVLN